MSDGEDSSPPQSNNPSSSKNELRGRALSLVVASSIILILLVYFAFIFYEHKKERHRNTSNANRSTRAELSPRRVEDETSMDRLPPLPVFIKLDLEAGTRDDCAVCLAEFLTAETGRVLPVCGHVFHKECIEKWFKTNSTCPVCRANAYV